MSKKKHLPTKTTLNLMILESQAERLRRMLPAVIIVAVLLAVFCKFAVIDRIAEANRLESRADNAERQLEVLDEQLADYDSVLMEYTRYFSGTLGSDKAVMPLDSMEVVELVEENIMSRAGVTSTKFELDTVTIQLADSTLEEASRLVEKLYSMPEVALITLYTADANDSGDMDAAVDTVTAAATANAATILLTITFQEVSE